MLLLDLANGMRRGELLALQWMDFDFPQEDNVHPQSDLASARRASEDDGERAHHAT